MILDRLLRPSIIASVVIALSGGALATAYIAQYGFGLEPCILCLYQRIPYAIAVALGLALLMAPPRWASAITALLALTFLGEAAIAFYHTGVEQHWWVSATGCDGSIASGLSAEELTAKLLAEPSKPCDRVDWTLFGLSITVYNTAVGVLAALGCIGAAMVLRTRREPDAAKSP